MKKTRVILLAFTAIILTFGSCKKSDKKGSLNLSSVMKSKAYSEEKPEYIERDIVQLQLADSNLVDFESVKNFFKLDFTPEYPDSLFEEVKAKNSNKKNGKKSSEKNTKSDSVIPGIRKLSDYITKYSTKKTDLSEYLDDYKSDDEDSSLDIFLEDRAPKEDPLEVINLWSGYIKDSDTASSWLTGARPPYEGRFVIRTNYSTTLTNVQQNIKVYVGGKMADYTVTPVYEDIFNVWSSHVEFDKAAGITNTWLVEIKSYVPHNTKVKVKDAGEETHEYDTLLPFKIHDVDSYTQYSSSDCTWPLYVSFNHEPDKLSLVSNTTYDNGKKITEDNVVIDGRYVKICNLPFDYNQTHTICFGKGVIDKYGQPLTKANEVYTFKTPVELAYVKYKNHYTTMLEAQFPHKMIFEHQNLFSGEYTLQKTDRPAGDGEYEYNKNESVLYELDVSKRNQRLFQEMDLDPFLDDGYGFVRFESMAHYMSYHYWEDEYKETQASMRGVVQVTDLGITARMALNKAIVMVRSLSTGKPVENAEVYIVHNLNEKLYDKAGKLQEIFVYGDENTYNNLIAQGRTDKNGIAIINYTDEQIERIEKENYSAFVYVVNGKDKAAFDPDSHDTWREGVSTSSIANARKPKQRTYMFTDRGIYKPGETVTFRGIDRDQLLGTFSVHNGWYSITAKGDWWDSEAIIEPIVGQLSESGGFYGSFKIPENIERGNYYILYSRGENSKETARVSFTVSDFEKVKFESSIDIPDVKYFGGDKLSANLSASYLAGGSLGGANYNVSWYKQATSFSSKDPAAKDYSFYNGVWGSRNYYSDDNGKLGMDGKTSLACTSEKITDGAPYIYHIETSVTDISNQRITAENDIWVNPALFYIGLAKAKNLRGFAKAGDKLEIPYLLANIDGSVMKDKELSQKVSILEYKLTHEVWTMVHEQSVDDTIYTRYECSDVEDASGTIKAQANSSITIKPEAAGWYTLTLTGTDTRGGKVISKSEFYVTGSGSSWFDQYNSNSLKLTPDKSQYNPGETAQVLLESPLTAGDYLITVEREGIFTEEVRHLDDGADVIDVPIAGNYVPVVYVSVSSYSERHGEPSHNYGEPDLDKPKGYYGVTPLLVNPNVRSFSIAIECDKPSYKPGETATIKIKATKGGKALAGAELTALGVDRGVLDLIGYHVPNPINFFYQPYYFPLRVYGGDSRSLLMDPVTYSIKNLIGGDSELKEMKLEKSKSANESEEEGAVRKDFRATAFFEPVIITDKNGETTVTFKMPDNLTTYRLTVMGVKDDLFAISESQVTVQNPINIQQVQPRRLRERDTAECGVLITNLGKDSEKISVSLEVVSANKDTEEDKLAGRKTIPGKAFVDGASSHTVNVASGQSSVVYFDVAASQEGTVNLVYTIKSNAINEKLFSPIRIEKTFVYETITTSGSISHEGSGSEKESLVIPGFAKEGRGDLKITLDATRLGLLGSSVNYLFDYPYGCLEQQSSRILPLVSFENYIDIFGMDNKIENIKDCVTSWTKKWKDYQHQDGGFGYWPDSEYSSDFVSMRILYIYALAIQRGYTPEDIPLDVEKLKKYVSSVINEYKTNNQGISDCYYDMAFACYIFSLLKDNSLNITRNELYAKVDSLTLDSAAYLSLAYSNTGKAADLEKAKVINEKIRTYLLPDQRSVSISKKAQSSFWFCYQNETIQYAAILSAFVTVNPDDEMVDRLIYTLLKKQSRGYWQNTVTTASVLESIYTYIQKRQLDSTDYTANASLNGREIMKNSFKGAGAKPAVLNLPFEDEFVSSLPHDKSLPLIFEKEGQGYLFYTAEMKYALPDEVQTARNAGLGISYEITDFESGKLINAPKDTSDIYLESGKMYKAKITIRTNRNRDYVAVRAPIPSGAEILDSSLITGGSAAMTTVSDYWDSWMSHKNITDNEIQFFWDDMRSGKCTVEFTFRAARRGIYPTPPVQGECMYEPEIFGRSDGYLFIIE